MYAVENNAAERTAPPLGASGLFQDVLKNLQGGSPWPCWLFVGPHGSGDVQMLQALASALLHTDQVVDWETLELESDKADFVQPASDLFCTTAPSVACARALISFLRTMPLDNNRFRIALLVGLDRATKAAQNILLKTLEEPPPRTLFFASAGTQVGVLPTLRSRMQVRSLRPLSKAQFAQMMPEFLARNGAVLPKDLTMDGLFQATCGLSGLALDFCEEGGQLPLYQALKRGMLPPDHPAFYSLFMPDSKKLWEGQGPDVVWRLFSLMIQGILIRFAQKTATPEEQAIAGRLSVYSWGGFLNAARQQFQDIQTYNLGLLGGVTFLLSLGGRSIAGKRSIASA